MDNYSADLFTQHRKFTIPVKNPADYDGTQSLQDYLKHFEYCSVVNGWSIEEAAVFLAASLHGEAQKVLIGMSDSDCQNYVKTVDKLELRFGVEKQHKLHQARLHNRRQQENESIQALAADIRSMSSLAYQDLSPDTQETFAVQHFIDATKDQHDRLQLCRDKPCTIAKPCPWLVNLTHFVSWMEIGQQALRRFALLMKLKGSLICLKLSLKCYVLTFKRNNNVRRLSKLLSNS